MGGRTRVGPVAVATAAAAAFAAVNVAVATVEVSPARGLWASVLRGRLGEAVVVLLLVVACARGRRKADLR